MKRAYGDWTTTNLRGWKDVLHKLAIQPMQQFSYTSGKNSTDSSLIIDAMDLLHGGSHNGFRLISSDSDFTRLATQIREAGLIVCGFGDRKTAVSFVAACDKFTYTEILKPQTAVVTSAGEQPLDALEPMLRAAIGATARDSGWATLSAVGSMILKNGPYFDPRNYGSQKLGELVRRQPYVEAKEVAVVDGSANLHLHVRLA